METTNNFSSFIKMKREELGMSLQEVADLAGISKGHLWEIEKARTCPSIDVAKAISNGLCIPLWSIFRSIGQ